MDACINRMCSLEQVSYRNEEELLLFARENRSTSNFYIALLYVKKLAQAITKQRKTNEIYLNEIYARKKSVEHLLVKELGIWCYLAYSRGASLDYLLQAEACLKQIYCLEGIDIELEMYYSFVLWSKWQNRLASPGDMDRCAIFLSHCAQSGSFQISQLDTVWFRLGYLYQVGVGCSQDLNKAQACFDRARYYGMDC